MNDNVKLIQDVYAAFGRGDIETITAKIADNADWRGPPNKDLPYSGTFKGPSGAAKFFDKIASSLRVTAWEPQAYVASGDEVMTTGSWSGVALATGKSFTSIWAMRFTVKGGKITYFQPYEDSATTLAAFRK
jgi:hypothetical protein